MKAVQYLFLIGFSFFSISLFAQKDRVLNKPNADKKLIHYGFYLGMNLNDFKLDYKPNQNYPNAAITITASAGFNVGLIADLRLHKNINLRFEPGLVSNSKTLSFNYLNTKQDSIRSTSSTYLHVPLVFKFSTNRLDNVRPFLLAGVSYDHNFSSNENNSDDNAAGEFRMKTSNFMYEIGLGIDIYLHYFKLSPSIRGVFAINNELKYDDDLNSQWTSPIRFLGSRGVFLNFSFEN